MPTDPIRQCLLSTVLHHTASQQQHYQWQCCHLLLKSELSDSYSSSNSSDSSNDSNDSSDTSSTSTSLSSSSSSSGSSSTHTAPSIASLSSSDSDSHETVLMKHCQASIQAMRHTWCFLHMILTT